MDRNQEGWGRKYLEILSWPLHVGAKENYRILSHIVWCLNGDSNWSLFNWQSEEATSFSACITYVHNEDIYHVYTKDIVSVPLQGCIRLLMTFSSFSIFYCILFQYSTVLKTFLFFSLKACKQFIKSDENVSPILTKTDRHSGMYFVCYFYFCIMSWLSVEMGLVYDLMQCIVHEHIQLHILWVCVSESGILLPFILQFSGVCKHLENFHKFHALFP